VRTASAVVTQSLTALNDRFWLESAEGVADGALAADEKADGDFLAGVRTAFLRTLSREPADRELELAKKLVAQHCESRLDQKSAWTHLCHMLLCSNEFLYIP
jgi:hypothetical protein